MVSTPGRKEAQKVLAHRRTLARDERPAEGKTAHTTPARPKLNISNLPSNKSSADPNRHANTAIYKRTLIKLGPRHPSLGFSPHPSLTHSINPSCKSQPTGAPRVRNPVPVGSRCSCVRPPRLVPLARGAPSRVLRRAFCSTAGMLSTKSRQSASQGAHGLGDSLV
jgi:hypothetical protein